MTFSIKFRSQIENNMSNYRLLRPSGWLMERLSYQNIFIKGKKTVISYTARDLQKEVELSPFCHI